MKHDEWFARASRVMPGGVNSPVRAFGSVGGTPRFLREAAGSRVVDVEGRSYIDFVGSWGVMMLGHDHPDVRRATAEALTRGSSFGAPTPAEVELAELVVDMVPSIEMVRLVNSGTEATMSALRLARAVSGRPGVIKFRGGYHGHGDSFLVEAGSGAATLGVPSSPGVTPGSTRDTHVADFNDLASVEHCFAAGDGSIGCLIVEPVAGNMGCVPPLPGFLEGLRTLCDRNDALLVFDEVMTGFRVAPGGAQERYDVRPDITTLGKVLGGGLPIGAYGGSRKVMERVAPSGDVYQAGTLSGNPLATAAGLATLRILSSRPELYERCERLTGRLGAGLEARAAEAGVAATWNFAGAMGSLFFTDAPVRSWAGAAGCDRDRFGRFFHGMLARGVYLAPSPFEAWFVSAAHTEEDVDSAVDAAKEVFGEIA